MNLIQRTTNFELLPSIFKTIHALPTSSAAVEQSFSLVKLVKTVLRNQLSELTLQSILMICERYKDLRKEESIEITDDMIRVYEERKLNINQRKSESKGKNAL